MDPALEFTISIFLYIFCVIIFVRLHWHFFYPSKAAPYVAGSVSGLIVLMQSGLVSGRSILESYELIVFSVVFGGLMTGLFFLGLKITHPEIWSEVQQERRRSLIRYRARRIKRARERRLNSR